MKKLFLTLISCFGLVWACTAQQPIRVFSVHFETSSAQLSQAVQDTIAKNAARLPNIRNRRVVLIGHTDTRGSLSFNQKLSEARAESVKQFLAGLTYDAVRIELSGRAYLEPSAEGDSPEALAANRRVDVIIEEPGTRVPAEYHLVSSQEPTELIYARSGSLVYIPADAFRLPNGRAPASEVIFMYREFRDFADFMSAGYPMNFQHNGQDAYFISTGMFELQAFDRDGTPLVLAPGKNIEIELEQTAVLERTEFWRFDERESRWTTGMDYIEDKRMLRKKVCPEDEEQRTEFLGKMDLVWPDHDDWGSSQDTIQRLMEAHALMREVLASAQAYDDSYVPQLDVNRFRHRQRGGYVSHNYAGTHYVGHLPFELAYANPKYYNVLLDFSDGKLLKLVDLSGENPELTALEGIAWQITKKSKADLKRYQAENPDGRYADVRITSKEKGLYTINLKYKERSFYLLAKPVSASKQRLSAGAVSASMSAYRKQYRLRTEAFDLALEQELDRALLLAPCVRLLLPRHFTGPEEVTDVLRMAAKSWPQKREASQVLWSTQQPSLKGEQLMAIPGYEFLAKGARYFTDVLLIDNLSREEWQARIANYDPNVYATVIPCFDVLVEVVTKRRPRLIIRGLGVFNTDVLERFDASQKLLASYVDENGAPIAYHSAQIINHQINSLFRFEQPSIYLDADAPSTLLVHALDGRVFCLQPEELAQLNFKGKESFTFPLKEWKDFPKEPDPKELLKLLGQG